MHIFGQSLYAWLRCKSCCLDKMRQSTVETHITNKSWHTSLWNKLPRHVKMNIYNKHKFRISITYFDIVFHCLRYDWCSLNHIISSSAVVYWHLTGKLTPPTVYVEPTPNIHFYSNGWKHTFICIFFCQFSGNFVKTSLVFSLHLKEWATGSGWVVNQLHVLILQRDIALWHNIGRWLLILRFYLDPLLLLISIIIKV